MEDFTPYSSFAGGMLIGISASLMFLFNGRMTGASSILCGLLSPKPVEWIWRLFFLIGMLSGSYFFATFFNIQIAYSEQPFSLLIIAGILVGFGTRLANGCTSGHGICGISLLSPRSLIATLVFMISGAFTVYVMRHLLEVA